MHQLVLVFLLLLSSSSRPVSAPPRPPATDAIVGRWLTADKAGIIQVYGQKGRYTGKIVGPENPPRLDANNPDPALRKRPLLGVVMLQDFRYDDEGAWKDGTIYDPRNGKTFSCTLRLKSASALEVRGYVGVSLFGRTEIWTRLP